MRLPIAAAASASMLCVALVGTVAFAQTGSDEATRTQLINEAMTAQRAGNHQQALTYAQRASAIRETGTLHGLISAEQLALGRTADALASAQHCERDAASEPASQGRNTILAWCRQQVRDLQSRVGRIVVNVSERPDGLSVMVGENRLNPALFGVPYIVTPGSIAVVATANGFQELRRSVTVAAGQTVEVPVQLQRAEGVASSGSSSSGANGSSGASSGTTGSANSNGGSSTGGSNGTGGSSTPTFTTRRSLHPVGPIVAGTGAAMMLASLVPWFIANPIAAQANMECPAAGVCSMMREQQILSQVGTLDTATNVLLFGGGGVLLVGAILTGVVRREEQVPTTAMQQRVRLLGAGVGPRGVSVTLGF